MSSQKSSPVKKLTSFGLASSVVTASLAAGSASAVATTAETAQELSPVTHTNSGSSTPTETEITAAREDVAAKAAELAAATTKRDEKLAAQQAAAAQLETLQQQEAAQRETEKQAANAAAADLAAAQQEATQQAAAAAAQQAQQQQAAVAAQRAADEAKTAHDNHTASQQEAAQQRDEKTAAYDAALTPQDHLPDGRKPTAPELTQRLAKLATQRENLLSQQAQANSRHNQLQGEIAAAQQQLNLTETALEQANLALEQARAGAAAAATEQLAAEQRLSAAQQHLAEISNTNEAATTTTVQELTAATQEAAAAEQQLTALNAALAEQNTHLEQAQQQLNTLTSQLEQKTTELAAARQHDVDLTAQIQALTDEIADLETAEQNITSQLAALQAEITAEENKTDNSSFTRAELIAPLATASSPLALYRNDNGTLTRVTELAAVPQDLSDYVLHAKSRDGKDITLDVTAITHDTSGSTPGFQATAYFAAAGLPTVTVAVREQPAAEQGVYTNFKSLLEALRSGATQLRLGADMHADEVALESAATAYVEREFTGALDGGGFQISGLSRPLFASLSAGSSVQNLRLSNVNIATATQNTAALARHAEGANLSQVHITSGTIRGGVNVGGLIADATNTTISDSTVVADIHATHDAQRSNTGGIVGSLSGGRMQRVAYRGDITVSFANSTANRVGGVVGSLIDGANMQGAFAGGRIHNPQSYGQVGGLVGSTWSSNRHGRISRAVSVMQVTGGHIVNGDRGFKANLSQVFTVTGESSGATDDKIDNRDVDGEYATSYYNAIILRDGASAAPNLRTMPERQEFTSTEARAERYQAYRNYAKLLPYASLDVIVRAGNMLADDDPLVTKELRAALATVQGKVSVDTARDAAQIDGLLLHFADRTVDRRALVRDAREAGAGQLTHYYMAGGLPFTTAQFDAADEQLAQRLAQQLQQITFESIPGTVTVTTPAWQQQVDRAYDSAVKEAAKKGVAAPSRAEVEQQVLEAHQGRLYLREPFKKQHSVLAAQLAKLIARESVLAGSDFARAELERKVLANQHALLLGLAYVNKWYDVAFDGNNLQDFFVFRSDFYGVEKSPLDALIELGSNYNLLNPRRNIETYRSALGAATGRQELADALDDLRQQFTKYTSFDDWFKATTKVYLVESKSLATPDTNVQLSQRLRDVNQYKSHLLPILTVSPDTAFIMTHITSIGFGFFDRYIDKKKVAEADRPARIAQLKQQVHEYAQKYREYYDMWYRIGNETMRKNLVNSIPVWDGFHTSKEYGPDAARAIEELYGPTGRWFKGYGALGFSFRVGTFMEGASVLGGDGSIVTYTHEMVHNMERYIFLGGEGMRTNASFEVYPNDLLQNPWTIGHDGWAFNQSTYFTDKGQAYLHNQNPNRFQTITDLNQYYKGYFDALYLLDNAEAEVLLERNSAEHASILMRLGNHEANGNRHLNSYQKLTADEIANMNLHTINDLIENELMIRRGQNQTGVLGANGYWSVPVLEPQYGTAESNLGITGESAFKRNAFELLAAKGYHDGFVPYTSDKYGAAARAAGQPHLPDTFIMPKIFNGQFNSLKDYRKHAYQANKERAQTHLKPIEVNFEGQQLRFTNYQEIVDHFRTLLTDDFNKKRQNNRRQSRVYAFKAAVFSALMRQTDEFKTSIFDDGDAALTPWVAPVEVAPEAPYVATLAPRPTAEVSDPRFATATLPEPRDEERLAQLRQQRDQLDARLQQITDDIAAVSEARTQLRADKVGAAAALERLQQAHTGLTRELERVTAEVSRRTLQHQQLRQDITAQQRLKDTATARQQRLREQLAALQTEISEAQQAVTAAQQELRQHTTANERAQKQLADVADHASATTATVQQQREQLATLRTQLMHLEQQLAAADLAMAENSEQTARVEKLQGLAAAAQRAVEAFTAAEQATEAATKQLAMRREAAQAALEQLRQTTRVAEQLASQRDVLRATTVPALLADDTAAAGYPHLLQLVADLRTQQQQTTALAAQVAVLQGEIAARQEALQTCHAHVAEAKAALQRAEAELARLLRLQQEAGGHEQLITQVPKNAPTAAALPHFEIPAEWLPQSPKNAPTAEALPHFEIPAEWLAGDAAQPGATQASAAGAQQSGAPAQLAATGSTAAQLPLLAVFGLALGGLLLGSRRGKDSEA